MKRLVLLIFIFFLASCSSSDHPLKPLTPAAVVVAFGDSLTAGSGTSPSSSYPNVLSKLISRRVVNAGVPGETTAEGLKRLPGVLEKYHPQLVILCLGGNDMIRKVADQKISDNLFHLVTMIKQSGAEVLLLAVPKPKIILTAPDFYQSIADEEKVPVMMNTLPELLGEKKYKSDAIHLNATGYRLLAEAIFKKLRQLGAIS